MAQLIGTAPNQIPTNADLGTMAFQDVAAVTVGVINVASTSSSVSTTTGALEVVGGVGIGGSAYVGNRVGFVNTSNVSVVYQVYNAVTNSLDTVFG